VHARLALEKALAELDVVERTIVCLRADGLRWSEIAGLLEMGESAAKMRGHRALQKLKSMLGD